MKFALIALPVLIALGSAAYAAEGSASGTASMPSACSADVQKYCASATSDADKQSCLQTNQAKLSKACRTAMNKSGESTEQPSGY